MAVNIKLKRSAVPGNIPTTTQLELGELALNTYDGKAFFKQQIGATETIVTLATTAGSGSSVVSASYALNASNADSASNANNANTANYASNAGNADTATSASYSSTSTSASYAVNASSSSYALNATTASYSLTSSYADSFTVAGTLTAQKIVVQTITSSTEYVSGSTIFGSDLLNTHQFTGSVSITGSLAVNGVDYISLSSSFDSRILNNSGSISLLSSSFISFSSSYNTGSFSGSFTGSLFNLQGTPTHIPFFSASQILANSTMFQVDNGSGQGYSIAINEDGVSTIAPEALYVFQPSTSSYNVISGKGNLNNYLQLNIQNTNAGATASSDVVATANNGTELDMYIDMGINGSNYVDNGNSVGAANDAYLYSTGKHLHIGNATPNEPLGFFVGGLGAEANRKFQLNPNNQHQMSGSLNITGSLFVLSGITGSLFGTSSWAVTSSYTLNALSSSYSLNSTSASYSLNATSASYALSSSFASTGNGIFSGSFSGSFQGNGSGLTNIPASGIVGLNLSQIASGSVTASVSPTFGFRVNANSTIIGSGSTVLNVSGSTGTLLQVTDSNSGTLLSVITGSTTIFQVLSSGLVVTSGSNTSTGGYTGSLLGTASYALNANTASYALNSTSASYALNATSASYAVSSTSASYSVNSTSASYAVSSTSASYSINSTSASYSSNSISASYSINSTSASYSINSTSASYAFNATSASYSLSASNASTASSADDFLVRGTLTAQTIIVQTITSSVDFVTGSTHFGTTIDNTHQFTGSVSISGSLAVNGSDYATTSASFDNKINIISSSYATTASNIFVGNQTVTGSLFTSGSNTLIGSTTLTGSLNVSGSTTQVGNNTLLGNTTLSGSIIISGSLGTGSPSVKIYGDTQHNGYIRFDPVTTNIDTSISASYIYVSGSTNDLYFSQNGNGYNNVTRLRWLEGNLYTGLLNGGLITAATGSTTFSVSSGSGIIVNLNASLTDNPYPTIKYVNWGNFTNVPITYLTSSIQTYVAIDDTGNIYQQNSPYNDGQYNTLITLGTVIHQNLSTVNASITYPNVAYGYKQRSYDFVKAFGPLKLSGYSINPSSSLGLTIGSGTAFADGRNYQVDPNNPSYITDTGTTVSKIFRYYQSGSTFIQDTNGGLGYTAIDPAQYNNNGTLTTVPTAGSNLRYTIQRVFWYPNSATKGIVVYYGNTLYTSLTEAATNIQYETFSETENTKQNAVYLGAIAIAGNGNFTTPTSYAILPGGIFRSVGGSGGGGSVVTTRLSDLSDVAISGPTDHQPLAYNTTAAKWTNQSSISASLHGNADTATSASHAVTASYVLNAVSSSYALNATSASYVLNAVSSSYSLNSTSASYSLTSSYAMSVSGGIIGTGTANYIPKFTGTNTLSTSSIYDDGTNIGIGTVATSAKLTVNGGIDIVSSPYTGKIKFAGLDTAAYAMDLVYPVNGGLRFGVAGGDGCQFQGYGGTQANFPGQMYFDYGSFTRTVSNRAVYFRNMTTGVASNVMMLTAASNVLINTTTDSGYKLDVNGTARFQSSTVFGTLGAGTGMYWDNTNNRLGIGASAPPNIFNVNLSNTNYTNTNGAGSHILMTNPSSTGQNVVASFINGNLVAKWRTDYVGNISWVAGSTGAHSFYTKGDFGVGTAQVQIFNNGNVQIATSPVGGSIADSGYKLDVSGSTRIQNTLLVSTGGISITGSSAISGSLIVTGDITGSLFGTSSYASNGLSSSYAINATSASYSINATSASYANSSISSSYALNSTSASYAFNATSASYALTATTSSYALTSSYADNFTVGGTLTAQTIYVQTITSSVDYVTGSTQFGSQLSDTHIFSGSVFVRGNLTINNTNANEIILSSQTSSMSVASSSYAQTASYVENAQTASYVLNAVSSSYSLNSTSASYALNSTSASYALNSTNAVNATSASNFVITNTLVFDNTLTDAAVVASSVVGSNNVFTRNTGSYTSAFFKYTVANGTNARSGEVMAVWNGTSVQYTDFSTLDIGSTRSVVTASVVLVGTDVQFNMQTNTSGWSIKSLVTFI